MEGLSRLDQGQWQTAADLFAGIERERPGYRDTQALLASVRAHIDYDQGRQAEKERNWVAAAHHYEAVFAADPNYLDVQLRLEECRRHEENKTLYGNARQVLAVGEPVRALAVSTQRAHLATASKRSVRVWSLRTGESWSGNARLVARPSVAASLSVLPLSVPHRACQGVY